jgi:hypothetical protein
VFSISLPSVRRLVKASRHGLRTGGTIYVGTLPINRGRDAECATAIELPYVATVTVDIGADYFAWSFRSAACILRSTVRMVSSSSTEMSAVAMS